MRNLFSSTGKAALLGFAIAVAALSTIVVAPATGSVMQKSGSPFLYDDSTGHLVGIRNSDGTDTFFPLYSTQAGATATAAFTPAAPGAIGGTTPAAGAFTTLSATGRVTTTLANGGGSAAPFLSSHAAGTGYGWAVTGQGADGKNWDAVGSGTTLTFRAVNDANTVASNFLQATRSAGAITSVTISAAGAVVERVTSAGVAVTGALSATGAIGYATGAGGTVTQTVSKSDTVTFNVSTGEITTDAAALNAATIVSFPLLNSGVAATDMLLCTHHSGGTLGAYTINCRATGAGTAEVTLRNNTAGNLAEALVIKFALFKSSTS